MDNFSTFLTNLEDEDTNIGHFSKYWLLFKKFAFLNQNENFIVNLQPRNISNSDCESVTVYQNEQIYKNFKIPDLMEIRVTGKICLDVDKLKITVTNPENSPDINKISHFEVKMNIYLNEMKKSASSEVVTLSQNSLTHHEIKLHPDFSANIYLSFKTQFGV